MMKVQRPSIRFHIALIVLMASASASAWGTNLTFKIERKDIAFRTLPERHITISAGCVKGERLLECAASQALRKADISRLKRDLFGRNPGALLCADQLGGRVVWARDQKGNERTFCQFKDGSYVGSGTLAHYGRKNSAQK
jgi:hypothetical protein